MNFFTRHPIFWIVVWSVFGLGGLVMAFGAVTSADLNTTQLVKGIIGIAVALIMIGYIRKGLRANNA